MRTSHRDLSKELCELAELMESEGCWPRMSALVDEAARRLESVPDELKPTVDPAEVVAAYRRAAMQRYGITRQQAERSIIHPDEDPGRWAPRSLAVIIFEYHDLQEASPLSGARGLDECVAFGRAAGVGYIEWINNAVGAVYE